MTIGNYKSKQTNASSFKLLGWNTFPKNSEKYQKHNDIVNKPQQDTHQMQVSSTINSRREKKTEIVSYSRLSKIHVNVKANVFYCNTNETNAGITITNCDERKGLRAGCIILG